MTFLALLVVPAIVTVTEPPRSEAAKIAFAKLHPCPATGLPVPSCKGYVIDHVEPLCAGGKDMPDNMQWQEEAASYKKDNVERAYCACVKKSGTEACQSFLWSHVN